MHTHFGERRSHVRTFETIQTDELRRRMERAIETMIATLDALDGDGDFEPANDDEPSLGFPSGRGGSLTNVGTNDDREEECEDEGSQCDDEGDWDERESDMAELGIADRDAADLLHDEHLALAAFEAERARYGQEGPGAALARRAKRLAHRKGAGT